MQAAISFPQIDPVLVSVDVFGLHLAIRWYALAYIAGLLLGWAYSAPPLRLAGRGLLQGGAQAQAAGSAIPLALAAGRGRGVRRAHQGRFGGIGLGAVHSGFLNFKVMRSLSPIASYLARSKVGSAGWPRGCWSGRGTRSCCTPATRRTI